MHPIIYYILFFIILAGIGMAIANKKTAPYIRRQRWLKYFTYIIFTGAVIACIFLHLFYWLAWILTVAAFVELLKVNMTVAVKKITVIKSCVIFLPVATGFLLFSKTFTDSFLLFIYFQVLVFDGFCQITGQLFGRHALLPSVSPSKTMEGLLGGWLFCIIAGYMAAGWLNIRTGAGLFGLLAGLLTGLTSFSGDLLASYYKRKVHVKDYSNWLPGQGGFLDRFDSLLMTGAVYYLLLITIFKGVFNDFINP
jgi:phosphatidate cytidylyltransferase